MAAGASVAAVSAGAASCVVASALSAGAAVVSVPVVPVVPQAASERTIALARTAEMSFFFILFPPFVHSAITCKSFGGYFCA